MWRLQDPARPGLTPGGHGLPNDRSRPANPPGPARGCRTAFPYPPFGHLLLALALDVAGLAAALSDDLPPLTGHHLAVALVRTGDAEVYLANPANGTLLNASRSPGSRDVSPCWSPDGRHIAFVSDRDQRTNLWVMDANGGNVRQLTHGPAPCYLPSWQTTPAGDRVVFEYRDPIPTIASIRPDGTDLRRLGPGRSPVLSPDGRLIAYVAPAPEGGWTLHLMGWNGEGPRRLTDGASAMDPLGPGWSPDGSTLVYSWPVKGALELFTLPLDSPTPRQLTTFGSGHLAVDASWSPDSQWIAFRRTSKHPDAAGAPLQEGARPPLTDDASSFWVIEPAGAGARPIESLRFQLAPGRGRAEWKPRVRFPDQGALPVEFPSNETSCDVEQLPDGMLRIPEPRRTRGQVKAIAALIPGGTFEFPAERWRHLPRTRARIEAGGTLQVVELGDSIINDTGRSGWIHLVRDRHPELDLRVTTLVRGSTGCWFYRDQDRIRDYVAPLHPDLVILGGISQHDDLDSIRVVIEQVRETSRAEVLLLTGAFGSMDPLSEATLATGAGSGWAPYGTALRNLADELECGFGDVTALWADYVRQSGQPVDWFKRDAIHPNERGEAILARIMDAWFALP